MVSRHSYKVRNEHHYVLDNIGVRSSPSDCNGIRQAVMEEDANLSRVMTPSLFGRGRRIGIQMQILALSRPQYR